jgi:2-oxoisovalerate dehydrogenase E1 component alpha subunit
MPAHYGSRKLRVVTGSSPVATHVVHAVGVALAAKIRGEDTVCINSTGEGGTSTGDWHEALNFAAVHRLPVIFMVENNQYAISVPLDKQVGGASIAARGAAYGMPGVSVDGLDVLAVFKATREAAERARRGDGPTLLEMKVVRLTAHSSDDSDRYRSKEQLAELRETFDPIARFERTVIDLGLIDRAGIDTMRAEIKADIDRATDEAEQAPFPDREEAFTHVYAEGSK